MIDLEKLQQDIDFLLSFAPADDPASVPDGLSPMFYFSNSYAGDVRIAQRIADIKQRYQNLLSTTKPADK